MKSIRILLGCVVLCANMWAQSDRGILTGTVSDSSGAIVPGAAVIAREGGSGAEYHARTTDTGNFTIASLPASSYDLTVTATGFEGYLQKGITIQVAQIASVNVVLQVGSITQTVAVTADAPLLRTENGEQSTTLTRATLNDLPINYAANSALRDPLAFAKLTPGVNYEGFMGGLRVNGLPEASFKITVEGQDMTGPNVVDQDYSAVRPSVDMMQEFTVEGSNFNAEYGQVSGGLFNFAARSGTNQLHGSAYEYWVNEALNAGRPFTDDGNGHLVRPRNRQNDYGFTVGGPVYIPRLYNGRNKTFFFFNFEQYRQHNASLGYFTVPTAKMRAGDFSEILTGKALGTDILGRSIMQNAIYDPTTARRVNGQIVTDPFAGNIIPSSRLDPAAVKIQTLIPTANQSGLTNNYVNPIPFPTTQIVPAFKIDEIISDKWRMSFYLSYFGSNTFFSNDGLPDPISTRRTGLPHSYTYRLNSDYMISPTLNLHAGIGFLRIVNHDIGANRDYDPTKLGMPIAASTGFPEIWFSTSSYGGFNNPVSPYGDFLGSYAATDRFWGRATGVGALTWVHGSHTNKFGGEFKDDLWAQRIASYSVGKYQFDNAETGLPYLASTTVGAGQIGFSYASFLLGGVDSGTVTNSTITQYRHPYIALYAQDTWKVTSRFTLDYGLRWEFSSTLHERFYRTSGFSGSTSNPSAGGLPGAMVYEGFGSGRCNCNFMSTYPYAFGPRIGGAYKLTSKTVLRGGWGFVYGSSTTLNYLGGNNAVVGLGFNTLNFSAPSFGTAISTLEQGLPFTQAQLNAASLAPGIVPVAGSISNFPSPWWDPHARPPRINTWNISAQREITPTMMVEAAYVGNRGVWEISGDPSNIELNNFNALSFQRIQSFGLNPTSAADRAVLTSTFASGIPQQHGFQIPYAGFPMGATLAQALRPFPQFGTIYTEDSPLGNSWYDALQAKVTNRFSHGLELLGSFTWSRSFLRGGDYRGRNVPINDSLNRAVNKDLSPEDQPFVLSVAFTYQIPVPGALTRNSVAKSVFGGWQLGGIFSIASGFLIQVPGSTNNLSQLTFQSTFVNRVPGVSPFLVNPNSHLDPYTSVVLNPAAWVDPGSGNWGTAAAFYDNYRWRRVHDEEANLAKTFKIKERVSFQIRAEFFNLFNRTVLNAPSSSNITVAQTVPITGFGRLNPGSIGSPRTGQLVGRITF